MTASASPLESKATDRFRQWRLWCKAEMALQCGGRWVYNALFASLTCKRDWFLALRPGFLKLMTLCRASRYRYCVLRAWIWTVSRQRALDMTSVYKTLCFFVSFNMYGLGSTNLHEKQHTHAPSTPYRRFMRRRTCTHLQFLVFGDDEVNLRMLGANLGAQALMSPLTLITYRSVFRTKFPSLWRIKNGSLSAIRNSLPLSKAEVVETRKQ